MPGVNVKGPKNGKYVRAKFIGSPLKGRQDLKTCSVILLISIKGNQYCTGDSFAASLKNAIEQYGKVTCLVVDTPHWYNLKIEDTSSPDKDLQKQALKLGDNWWNDNENAFVNLLNNGNNNAADLIIELSVNEISEKIKTFNYLAHKKGIHCNVVRWDDWLSSENCSKEIQAAEEKYTNIEILKSGIEETASEFARRHDETYKEISKNYLITECPGIMIIGAKLDYDFIAYPGDINSALATTHEYFVKPHKANKVQWLRIDFKRYNEEPKHKSSKQEIKSTTSKQEVKFLFGSEHNFFVRREQPLLATSPISVSYDKVEQFIYSNIIQTMNMLPPEAQDVCRKHLIDLLLNFSPERAKQKLTELQPFQDSDFKALPLPQPNPNS